MASTKTEKGVAMRDPKHADLKVMIVGGNFQGKGAEAMLFTVADAIRKSLPGTVICVAVHPSSEVAAMRDHGFIPILWHQGSRMRRITTAAAATLGWMNCRPVEPEASGHMALSNPFRASDVVVDIAGFASGDQKGWRKAFGRWRDYRMARAAGNRILFMPQAWGPFTDARVRYFTRRMLRQADLIFAREQQSYDYLSALGDFGRDRVHQAPDIAFQFDAGDPRAGRAILARLGLTDPDTSLVGITPNLQIYQRTAGRLDENAYVRLMGRVLRFFLDATNSAVVLIPHEIETDDRLLCEILHRQFAHTGRVVQLAGTESAAEVKSVIGALDFLAASRYHSLIAAMSLSVPVVVIGWSHKYDQLLRSAGMESWGIDFILQPGEAAFQLVVRAWENRDAIREIERKNVPAIQQASRTAIDRMVETLRSIRSRS